MKVLFVLKGLDPVWRAVVWRFIAGWCWWNWWL